MTARPVEIEDELRLRPDRTDGGEGAEVHRLSFVVIVDNVRSLWNIGSIFRTADACGVERLILTGISGCPPRAEITKTALGAEQAVAWDYRGDTARALREVVRDGYVAVALESGPDSRPVDALTWPDRVCLVIGNEVAGIAPEILDTCRYRVRIPMLGVKQSLNVAVAFGIAGHRIASSLTARERACHSEVDDG